MHRLLAVAAVSSVVTAQASQWVHLSPPTSPPGREAASFAYDAQRQRSVLFGGQVAGGFLASATTWEWDGGNWTAFAGASPSARQQSAAAYDSLRARVVLFGGWDGINRGDTWERSGTTWIPQVVLTGPSPRSRHRMAYDSVRGRVVLFGGWVSGALSDTWEWDGIMWAQAFPPVSPPARASHGMAFDPVRGRTVLFGGAYAPTPGSPVAFLGDTWEWDGSTWVLVSNSGSGPSPRMEHAMAFDTSLARIVLVGGWGGAGTWEWNGVSWWQASASPSHYGHVIAYDSHRNRTVLFGGSPAIGDTWERASIGGVATAFGTGCGSPALSLTAVPSSPPTIGSVAQATIGNAPSPLAFVSLGVSNTWFGPFTLPVSLASVGMPGCDLLQSAELTSEGTTPSGPGTATYSFAIPNNPAFVGLHLYLQAWAWALGANAANVILSNGLDWQIG